MESTPKSHLINEVLLNASDNDKNIAINPTAKEQLLKLKTEKISDFLRYQEVKESLVDGSILESRNFYQELERISENSKYPELIRLADMMKKNKYLSEKSNIMVAKLKKAGYGWSAPMLLNLEGEYDKIMILGQSIVSEIHDDEVAPYQQEDQDESILHEQIHYYTYLILYAWKNFCDTQPDKLKQMFTSVATDFAQQVSELHKYYQQNGGLLSLEEFVAYGLTSVTQNVGSPLEVVKLKKIRYQKNNLYEKLFTVFTDFYKQINPELFIDRINENGDPLPKLIDLVNNYFQKKESKEK